MAEYIERDALLKDLRLLARYEDFFRQSVILGVVHTIECKPAADVVPMDFHERCLEIEIQKRLAIEPKHGRWEDTGHGLVYKCSECGDLEDVRLSKFCPDCGARMDKEKEPEG